MLAVVLRRIGLVAFALASIACDGAVTSRGRDASLDGSLDASALDAPGALDAGVTDAAPVDLRLAPVARDVAITPVLSARVPDVAFDDAHDAYVVAYTWVPGEHFRTEARVVTVSSDGAPIASAPIVVDELETGVHNSADVSVAAPAGDEDAPVLVVWSDDRLGNGDGSLQIYGQLVRVVGGAAPSLTREGDSFRISDADRVNEYLPDVAWTGSGYYVIWADDAERFVGGDDLRVVWGRTVSVDGVLGPLTRLGTDAHFQTWPQVERCGDRVLAAWSDYLVPGGPLLLQYEGRVLDAATGAPTSDVVTIASDTQAVPSPPGLACDTRSGTWRVTWAGPGPPSIVQIAMASVDRDGLVGAPRVVTSEAVGAGAPRLAYVWATDALALSTHAQDSYDGFVQELALDGSPRGATITLTDPPPSLGTFWTAIAAHATRAEVLVAATLDYDRVSVTVLRGEP